MKTIDTTDRGPTLEELLRLAAEENLVLRMPDGKEFVLAEMDDFDREIALVRQQPELTAFLAGRFRPGRTFTIDQARGMLDLD